MRQPLAETSGEYTSFAHRVLWESSRRHLLIAGERPSDSWMLHLSAGLLGAAAFEAYLNYVGEEMLPHVWKDERRFFSSPTYRGTNGKLRRIAEELGFSLPPRTHKPYAGWLSLVELRDKLVHARPKKVTYRTTHRADKFPKEPTTWLRAEASPEIVRTLIDTTECFATELHSLILRLEFRHVVFGSHPFLGALAFGSRRVRYAG